MKTKKRHHRRAEHAAPKRQVTIPGEEQFDSAVRLHVNGDLDGALAAYDAVLVQWPAYAEAHHNAAVIRAQRGQLGEATTHLRRAVELNGHYAEAHHSLALVLNMAGARREAVGAFRRAAELKAASVDWWTDLGTALNAEGRFAEGLEANDRALALQGDNPQSLANRAVPLRGLHRLAEAADACRASLALRPDNADTYVNLGIVLKESGDLDGARDAFDRALATSPRHLNARINIAVLLQLLGRHAEAREIAEALVTEVPEASQGWTLLGVCAIEAADFTLAERCAREALARSPDNASAEWNLAQVQLLRGNFQDGLQHFEARKRLDMFESHSPDAVEWKGQPLGGRTVLVHAEQGFGDSIQFIRALPLLKARGAGRVILDQCPPEIASLLRSAPGIDELVVRGERPSQFDVHTYLMSLPFQLGMRLESLPREVPYLAAPERQVADFIRATGTGMRVGLVWSGNRFQARDRARSAGLEALAPVLATPGVTFFSLQKGEGARELDRPGYDKIVNLDPMLLDFGDTAAAISALDVVITIDTSVAHLAGALGKPALVLLAHVADWRWFLDREDSPWYPTMRLLRQAEPGDWSVPVRAAARALAELVDVRAGDVPVPASTDAAVAAVAAVRTPAATTPVASRIPIEIDWPIGFTSGWGTYGLHLALALGRSSRAEPVLAADPALWGVNPLAAHQVRAMKRSVPADRAKDAIHATALGNRMLGAAADGRLRTGRRVGVLFFEDTAFDAAAKERAFAYDTIIAGSTWNLEMLKSFGVGHARLVLQGIDPTVFHPSPHAGLARGRFLVFSGGKLEFRKGQDIVVEAFRRFHATHPDAMLVTSWHNHLPQSMGGIDAMGYVRGRPVVRDGMCDTTAWLIANGIAGDSVLDLGVQPQASMAQVLREMDVAVFTNRCEGGTNLVAMEAMACGVPTILSANTGHLNLIGRDTTFPLEMQGAVSVRSAAFGEMLCWGESDPDEVVAMLESVYDDRAEAERRGAQGAKLLAQLPWQVQGEEFLRQLGV